MKYPTNSRVQFSVVDSGLSSGKRYVYFRIYPKDLSLFKRLFHNPWRQMFHAFNFLSGKNLLFSPKEYMNEIKPLQTLGDVRDYLTKQKNIINSRYVEEVNKGERWEDECD